MNETKGGREDTQMLARIGDALYAGLTAGSEDTKLSGDRWSLTHAVFELARQMGRVADALMAVAEAGGPEGQDG